MFTEIRNRPRYLNANILVYALAAFGVVALIWLVLPYRRQPDNLVRPVQAATSGGPVVSYADTVARVAPSVVTVLAENARVRPNRCNCRMNRCCASFSAAECLPCRRPRRKLSAVWVRA